jgi:hypothetical protein
MIKLICFESPRGDAYKRAAARLNKVGHKCGYYSWYVDVKHIPTRLLGPLKDCVVVVSLGRITMRAIALNYWGD